jgi:phosphatidylserine/phosphatidylglycerophosphate/cardiolipin synthase-like enzyme
VFQTLLDIMEEMRARARARWGDDRLVWLPLQYGLLPEDHATQSQMDDLIARAVDDEFLEGNRVTYLLNEQFHEELPRSLEAARDYHVLWIHDFRGRNAAGAPDRIAYSQVLAYLRTLTRRVEEYDRVGRLPVFVILLDQHYYELNHSRLWLGVLERPLTERVRLAREHADMAATLGAVQDSLRDAVERSETLQLEANQYGRAWLENLVKVHVNITNPADYTFNSAQIVPIFGLPDNVMRDHRKILFYDITEEDPYRGMAVYTGMGVGEHYAGPAWEDRAIALEGPAALSVKESALALLRIQGFEEDEIPWPLRPRPLPPDYATRVAAGASEDPTRRARVLEVHNGTGYARKQVDVAKATLYTLASSGTVIQAPDALWGSQLFGGMLLGASLRGARVLVMAPSLASAPSAGWPQMARAYELLARLLVLETALAEEIGEVGGLLKVGIYHPQAPVGDLATRFGVFGPARPDARWFRELFDFHPAVDRIGARVDSMLQALEFQPVYLVEDIAPDGEPVQPRLHLKGHFVASAEAWEAVVRNERLAPVLERHLALTAATTGRRYLEPDELRADGDSLAREMSRILEDALSTDGPAAFDPAMLYLTVGSPNQDYRSLMLDGEAMVIVSGTPALVGFFDFVVIAGQCRWVETVLELQELLPEPSNVKRLLARWIKTLL